MEKRLFLFIALAMSVLFAYSIFFTPKAPETAIEGVVSLPGTEGENLAKTTDLPTTPQNLSDKTAFPTDRQEEGKDIVIETDLYKLTFTTQGARLKSCRLKKYSEVKVTEKTLAGDLKKVEKALGKARDTVARRTLSREMIRLKYLQANMPESDGWVELVPFDGAVYGDYPLTLESKLLDPPGIWNTTLYRPNRQELILDEGQDSGSVSFLYLAPKGIEIEKKFTFYTNSYCLGLEIIVRNNSSDVVTGEDLFVTCGPGVGLIKKTQTRGRHVTPFATWAGDRVVRDRVGKTIGQGLIKKTTMQWDVPRHHPGPIEWTALRSSYFAVALIPEDKMAAEGARLLENGDGTREIALKLPSFSLSPGGETIGNMTLYLGPQDMNELRRSHPGLERLVDFGFWAWIGKPIHQLLGLFYSWVNNYGVSIILLSLIIKLIFYPFTHKSFEAMKGMQEGMKALQPEIDALKEKYKDNPQKLNKATMELYKKRGVNPMSSCRGGCLPMLFQMPVFFSLYAVLYNSIGLRQANFLWIKDLANPDPYFLMPVLMGITMYFQQKLTGMGGSGGGSQPDQAKMMSYIMPVMLTVIFFNLPSGIVLYWFCFNVFTSLQQLIIKNKSDRAGK